jgi:hypothetical protein
MRYRDYEEFIGALNDRGAKYLIVGGDRNFKQGG